MAATVESHAGLWCGQALGCGDNISSVADVVWDDRLEWASLGGWHEGVFFSQRLIDFLSSLLQRQKGREITRHVFGG